MALNMQSTMMTPPTSNSYNPRSGIRYTHAIVCRFPKSFEKETGVHYQTVKDQHEKYVRILRDIGLDVIELESDEETPMCAYVEDMAVVCNGIALITKPVDTNRAKEAKIIKIILKKELDMPFLEIQEKKASLDGGDVLFTGREFFVGIGKWTNEGGAKAVAKSFPEFPCTSVKLPGDRRLKSLMTMAGPDIICVSSGQYSQAVLTRIKKVSTFSYQTVTVPEEKASNVLYVNDYLIHCSADEIPLSTKTLADKLEFCMKPIRAAEMVKSVPGLTSCSLLIRRPKINLRKK